MANRIKAENIGREQCISNTSFYDYKDDIFLRLKVRNSLYVSLFGSKSCIITAQVFNVLFDKLNNCLLIYQFLRQTAIRVPCSLVRSCNCYCTCNNVLTNFNHRLNAGITGIQHHTQPCSFPNEKLPKRVSG